MTETYQWQDYQIELTGENSGHCDCCQTETSRVWGFIHKDDITVAAYFVGWTVDSPDHGTSFDVVMGTWGDGTTKADKFHAALDFKIIEGTPNFMVVDAGQRTTDYTKIAETHLKRTDIIGTPLAPQLFALVDAVYMSNKLAEIRSWTANTY